MDRLSEAVLTYARSKPEGFPVLANAFLHLGKKTVINQVLSGLASREKLIGAGGGVYFLPVNGMFGFRPPSVEKAIDGLRSGNSERIANTGAMSANFFGLTKHLPMRYIFLTSGLSRKLMLDKLPVELQHAPPWQLVLSDSRAGDAVRALAWWGQESIEVAVAKVRERLTEDERRELKSVGAQLPSWLETAVREVCHA